MMDAQPYLHEGDGLDFLARHEELDDIDLRGLGIFGRIDMRCSSVHWLRADHIEADSFYGWNLFSHRPQFNDARFGRVNLHGFHSINPIRFERIHVEEDVILSDADYPYANFSDAFIGNSLRIRGEKTGRTDLRGAGIGRIDTLLGTLEDQHVIVDEDTYLHEVPDYLSQDLGYRGLSDEAGKIVSVAADRGDAFTFEALREDYKSILPEHEDYLPSLVGRTFLEHGEDGYTLTKRGQHASRFLTR